MKLSSLLASSSLLLVTAVAACGGDEPGPGPVDPVDPVDPPAFSADFGGASDDLLRRAAISGAGLDAFIATISTAWFAGVDDPTGCPAISTVGNVTTVTGGCTTGEGSQFTGSVVLTNVQSFQGPNGYDPTQPSSIQFDNYQVDDGVEQPLAFDGRVEYTATQLSIELESEVFGLVATSSLDLTIDADNNQTANEGSMIDVEGLGTAEVTGSWNYGDEQLEGSVTLTGVDAVTFDFENAVEDCIPYSIDGQPVGELCDPAE